MKRYIATWESGKYVTRIENIPFSKDDKDYFSFALLVSRNFCVPLDMAYDRVRELGLGYRIPKASKFRKVLKSLADKLRM